MEAEDGTELLHSHGKSLTAEELFPTDEQRKGFLEIEPTSAEHAVKTAEMTTQESQFYKIFIFKEAADFDRIHYTFKRSSTIWAMLSNSIACYREVIRERKSQSMWQNFFSHILRNCRNHLPDPSAAINAEASPSTSKEDYDSLKTEVMVSIF